MASVALLEGLDRSHFRVGAAEKEGGNVLSPYSADTANKLSALHLSGVAASSSSSNRTSLRLLRCRTEHRRFHLLSKSGC